MVNDSVKYLHAVFICKRSWRNLDIRIMMKGSMVKRSMAMSRADGSKLGSSKP